MTTVLVCMRFCGRLSHQCESPWLSSPVGLCEGVQPCMWMHLCPHPRVSTPTTLTVVVRVCVRASEDRMVRIKRNQLQLLILLHFFFVFCVFLHVMLREPNKTQVFSFFQTDLGGFLPRSVVDSFFPSSMAEFYSNLAKAVKSLKDL